MLFEKISLSDSGGGSVTVGGSVIVREYVIGGGSVSVGVSDSVRGDVSGLCQCLRICQYRRICQ